MKECFVFTILLLLSASSSVSALKSQVIASVSCKGDVIFLPDSPLRTSMAINPAYWRHGYFYLDRMYSRAQCSCPSLPRPVFDNLLAWNNISWVIGWTMGSAMDWQQVCEQGQQDWKQFISDFDRQGMAPWFQFPSSINLASLGAGETQYARLLFNTSADVSVAVSFGNCPLSLGQKFAHPWVQLYTLGKDAASFGRPCNSNRECSSGLNCMPLLYEDGSNVFTFQQMFDAFQQAYIYDHNDSFPGCSPVPNVLSSALSWAASSFFPASGDRAPMIAPTETAAVNLCLPPSFTSINSFTDLFDSTACPQNENGTIVCSNVVAYDGTGAPPPPHSAASPLMQQEVVDKRPPKTLTSGAKVLFSFDCNGTAAILPSFDRVALFAQFNPSAIVDLYTKVNQKIQQCRATQRGGSLSAAQFRAYYGYAQTWLYNYLWPNAGGVPAPSQSTILDLIGPTSFLLQLPDTCSYDSWPLCALSYTGISSLTGLDVTINAQVRQCPLDANSVSIYAECVGSGCTLPELITCSGPDDDSSCPVNSPCVDLTSYSSYTRGVTSWFFNYDYQGQCVDEQKRQDDIRAFVRYFSGQQSATGWACFTPPIDSEQLQEWANAQAVTNGNVISLSSVQSWIPPPQ